MEKCLNCGKTVLIKTCFGNNTLCKTCDSLINASSWNKREFASMDELLEKKNNALQLAKTNNISEAVTDAVEKFFDEYIKDGFVTSINGRAGQTLKVFENYCIVNTKSESAQTSLVNMFYQFDDDDDDDDDEVLTADDKLNLAKGVLRGGLIKTGIGVAMSAGLKQSAKEQQAEKKERAREKKLEKLIKVGDKKLNFKDYCDVETYSKVNTANGYLKFVPNGVKAEELYECDYFFFNNSIPFESKKIKQKVENVKKVLEEKIENAAIKEKEEKKKIVQEVEKKEEIKKNDDSKFDEIRKYKQLLDEGIITEEEFQAKKKELLNL